MVISAQASEKDTGLLGVTPTSRLADILFRAYTAEGSGHIRGARSMYFLRPWGLLRPEVIALRCAELQRRVRQKQIVFEAQCQRTSTTSVQSSHSSGPWSRIEQALRSTDLLLQGGGNRITFLSPLPGKNH
jgi:hypothetical protein